MRLLRRDLNFKTMEQRYKVICAKSYYYFGVLFAILWTCAFLFIFEYGILSRTQDRYIIIAFGFLSLYPFFLLYRNIIISIHLKVDLKERTIIYGNMLAQQETSYTELKGIKKRFFTSKGYVIYLDNHKYYISAEEDDILFLKGLSNSIE